MLYTLLLMTGLAGLASMALLGFLHVPGALHRASHRAPTAPHGPHSAASHAVARPHPGTDHAAGVTAQAAHQVSLLHGALAWLAPLLSPLTWFSWFCGAGASGLLASSIGLGEGSSAAFAVAGALLFQRGLVQPIWDMVFRFESAPAGNLDACLFQDVEAVSAFDAQGRGLVRVRIDGRTEDVLASLIDLDGAPQGRVRRGDLLVIQDVDPRTSTCRVSRKPT